jgi:hypothetical protein
MEECRMFRLNQTRSSGMRTYSSKQFVMAAAALAGSLAIAGCGHPAYYAAPMPPPPPVAYAYTAPPPIAEVAQNNGYADGLREGREDRWHGHSFRPRHSDRFEDAPGYSPSLGGSHREYRHIYRDAFYRGYQEGYGGR